MNTRSLNGSFQLKLFGSPSLRRADGAPLTGRAAQRHRLALLSLLARSDGASRERLMALLWPESDLERARNLLKVSVYVLRQTLGEDALLSEGDELRLNTERVETDVALFEAALEKGDHQSAVTLVDGPLLDGFHLSDAPEFEHWLEQERQRLAHAHGKALEALAEAAAARGDAQAAVDWWKARATQDPLDSRVALRLMQALEASGNPAGALRHADLHERLLKEELGIDPSPPVRALADRLRAAPTSRDSAPPVSRAPPLTPQAVDDFGARKSGAPATRGQDPSTKRRLRRAPLYVVAVLAVGALIVYLPVLSSPSTNVPSIAVLPLRNLTADPRDAALADVMTEELISILGREPGKLRAISSTSVLRFRDRQNDVRVIADSMDVSNILEGNLQRIDGRVRLMVRLVDGRDGSLRWTESYEREYRDIFSEQENIARAVGKALEVQLTNTAGTGLLPNRTQDGAVSDSRVAAFDLLIQGRKDVLFRTASGRRQALDLFRQAAEVDSTYAPARAELAHLLIMSGDDSGTSRRERLTLAEKEARAAIALDGSLADAHAALGHVLLLDYQFAEAEAHLKRAITLDPTHLYFREFLVWLYILMGQPREALREAHRATEDNPHAPTAIAEVARTLLINGRCGEALKLLDQLRQLQPPPARMGAIAAQCHARKGEWRKAIEEVRPVAERNPVQAEPWLGLMLARAGQTVEANQIRIRVLERWRHGKGGAFDVAMIHAGFGELDQTFEWLNRSIDDRSLRFDIMEPAFEDVRRDHRFEPLLRKLGNQRR